MFVECRGLIVLPTAGSEHLRGPSCAQCSNCMTLLRLSGGSAEAGLLKRTSHTLTPNHPTHTIIAERSVDIVNNTHHHNNIDHYTPQQHEHPTLPKSAMPATPHTHTTHNGNANDIRRNTCQNLDPKGHPTYHVGQHSNSALTMATAMAMTKATTIRLKRRRRRRRRSHRPQ